MTTPYRALIVDDVAEIRKLTAHALGREGFRCDEAEDGVVAENLLRLNRYDVVLADLKMPRKHGYALIAEILEKPDPPLIIVITGVAEPKLVYDLTLRGVADFLVKPLHYNVLVPRIKALLERRMQEAPSAGRSAPSMTQYLETATQTLREQLAQVTQQFQNTIAQLEKQKQELSEGLVGAIRVLTNLMTQAGQVKESHVLRVEAMASWLAKKLALDPEDARYVKSAALLHDIGQFGMPDAIRRCPPWQLDEEARKIYEQYPIIGATLISEVPGAERIAELIETHAENFDGSGFPFRKARNNIPMGARIIRIADAVDTFQMFSENPDPQQEVLNYITEQKGVAFDPLLVPLAIRYVLESGTLYPHENTRLVSAQDLLEGMVLAADVFDTSGRFLARRGVVLTSRLAHRLGILLGEQKIRIVAEDKAQPGNPPSA